MTRLSARTRSLAALCAAISLAGPALAAQRGWYEGQWAERLELCGEERTSDERAIVIDRRFIEFPASACTIVATDSDNRARAVLYTRCGDEGETATRAARFELFLDGDMLKLSSDEGGEWTLLACPRRR